MPRILLAPLVVGLLLVASSHLRASERPTQIVAVDDRGERIAEEFQICFRVALERDCRNMEPGGTVSWPEHAESLTAEGPRHGPVSVRRGELSQGDEGSLLLVLPRKAELAVPNFPAGGEISLYRATDPLFLRPAFRYPWDPHSLPLWIPAGDFVVSLAARGNAPDLHHVAAKPGGHLTLRYRGRPGWSVVLRVVRAEDGRPVPAARVRILDGDPASQEPRELTSVISDKGGLALLSGFGSLMVSARVDHPDYVRGEAHGILAAPGTFAFRELVLREGALVEAEVTLRDDPAPAAVCRILAPPGPGGKYRGEAVAIFEASADAEGRCSFRKVPEGRYTLRVLPPGEQAHVDRPLNALDGERTQIAVDLRPIRVRGEVLKGDEPAAGYRVDFRALRPERNGVSYHSQGEATTGDDGSFEATVWAAGSYVAILSHPGGTPAMTLRADLWAEEERLDFYLKEQTIDGVVVDSAGKPVTEASVTLIWNDSSYRLAVTGADGRFEFPVDSEGVGRLVARKAGWVSPDEVEVRVVEGVDPPPVILELGERPWAEGIVVSGSQVPLGGVWLASYGATDRQPPRFLGEVTTTADGRFRLPRLPVGLTRIFASGPGCPLSETPILGDSGGDLTVTCTAQPGALVVRLTSDEGAPVPGLGLILRSGSGVIPRHALRSHLARFGLPAVTDGSGQLTVILEPGSYELFLEGSSSEESVAAGYWEGFLASTAIAPLSTEELLITVDTP